MKIGLKAKAYEGVVCIEIDDSCEDKNQFITGLFSCLSAVSEDEVDFVITVGKKKINITKGENETE